MSSNLIPSPSRTLNFPENILPDLDTFDAPLGPPTYLDFTTSRMTSPERTLHSPPLMASTSPDQRLSQQPTQFQSFGETSHSAMPSSGYFYRSCWCFGVFVLLTVCLCLGSLLMLPPTQRLPAHEAIETDNPCKITYILFCLYWGSVSHLIFFLLFKVVPEDRQVLEEGLGQTDFSLNELDIAQNNQEVIETTNSSCKFACNSTA